MCALTDDSKKDEKHVKFSNYFSKHSDVACCLVQLRGDWTFIYFIQHFNFQAIMEVTVTFKTENGVYKVFTKKFSDDSHLENFSNMMMQRYGWKLVGEEKKKPMAYIGFTTVSGVTRKLTLGERCKQIIFTNQGQDIDGLGFVDVNMARIILTRYKKELLNV